MAAVLKNSGKVCFLLQFLLLCGRCNDYCSANDVDKCTDEKEPLKRYLLYDVNPPEGFNLRRDVYVRMAVFAKKLQRSDDERLKNFRLVLPPWTRLYHWRSKGPTHVPWSRFFDLESLQRFAAVIEMHQFFNEVGGKYTKTTIDEAYVLQNYKDMFENGVFEEKMSIEECEGDPSIDYFLYKNLTAKQVYCLSFQGHVSQLTPLLEGSVSKSILFHHAEVPLHDHYGEKIYWEARRSMRFNKELRSVADEFRRRLNSTDKEDGTVLPDDWMEESTKRTARGGPYLCAHLRRRDFVRGRPKEVPDLENAARQIRILLTEQNLENVFIATDAPAEEFDQLQNLLPEYKVHKYWPSKEDLNNYYDGGVAIIEQIICSHARYFVGTHESTFSFRIQEEREIMGFPVKTTFNRLCGINKKCSKPSTWKIIR